MSTSVKPDSLARTDTATNILPLDNGGLSVSKDFIKKLDDAQPKPPPPVAPAPPPLVTTPTYANDYAWGNCTAFVASVVQVPDNLGNANTWAAMASQDGYTVSPTPKVGSVAQTSAGYEGHVALVEDVQGSQVLIKEANVQGLGVVDERWVDSGQFRYIYFTS